MDNKKKQFKGFRFSIFWMYAIIGMVLMGLFYFNDSSAEKPMNWQPDFKRAMSSICGCMPATINLRLS